MISPILWWTTRLMSHLLHVSWTRRKLIKPKKTNKNILLKWLTETEVASSFITHHYYFLDIDHWNCWCWYSRVEHKILLARTFLSAAVSSSLSTALVSCWLLLLPVLCWPVTTTQLIMWRVRLCHVSLPRSPPSLHITLFYSQSFKYSCSTK